MTLFALILAIGIVVDAAIIGKRLFLRAPRLLPAGQCCEIGLHNFVQRLFAPELLTTQRIIVERTRERERSGALIAAHRALTWLAPVSGSVGVKAVSSAYGENYDDAHPDK